MCDPATLGVAVALGVAGKLVSNSESTSNANAQATASNAALQTTLGKEQGFSGTNQAALSGNLANYAPGAQDTKLADAQGARTATSTGNITTSPTDQPVPDGSPPAVQSDLAKRMLAVHEGAVNRAKLNGTLGGYGDTWFNNGLNTSATDRNIGVTNNLADGQKAILPALQADAQASAYKAPSIWSTILGGASSIAAGKAGAGGTAAAAGSGAPMGSMQVGDQLFPAFGAA